MREFNFRTLKANEIEIRPQSVKNGMANMLLYIDSRAVVKLLDETVGNMNWQSEFYSVNGQTMCKIGIWDEDRNIWIWKSDTGSESNVEAEKGLISDCYKRVLSRWGITELYSSPKISWNDDGYGNTGYKVSEIEYNENREITHLVIVNRFNKEVYRWDMGNVTPTYKTAPKTVINDHTSNESLEWTDDITTIKDNKTLLTEFCTEKKNSGDDKEQLKKFYNYYVEKANGWKGTFNITALYNKWMTNAKAA
jgi:hypothetical protein